MFSVVVVFVVISFPQALKIVFSFIPLFARALFTFNIVVTFSGNLKF